MGGTVTDVVVKGKHVPKFPVMNLLRIDENFLKNCKYILLKLRIKYANMKGVIKIIFNHLHVSYCTLYLYQLS